MTESKPLNWYPTSDVGYSVIRRGDGGIYLKLIAALATYMTCGR